MGRREEGVHSGEEGTDGQLCRVDKFGVYEDEACVRDGSIKVGNFDTGEMLLAWHFAAERRGIDHTMTDLSCLVERSGALTVAQWELVLLLHHTISRGCVCNEVSRYFGFQHDIVKHWSTASVKACFCRELDYVKLRETLCRAGDVYILQMLIRSRLEIDKLVCMSLGWFKNDANGMCRAIAAKETFKILQDIGFLRSARVIVHHDSHGSSTATILAARSEIEDVQSGFLTQLDAQKRVAHLHESIEIIQQLFEKPSAFEYKDWRPLGAFATLVARCCDHSGELLLQTRLCNLSQVPASWLNKGNIILDTLTVIISTGSYFRDVVQCCANLLLEIDENGGLSKEILRTFDGGPVHAEEVSHFFEQITQQIFGERQSTDAHSCKKRWVSLIDHNPSISILPGSEHAFICCALTTHVPMARLAQVVPQSLPRFLAMDQSIESRIKQIFPANGNKRRRISTSDYDPDQLFEALNLHKHYHAPETDKNGKWSDLASVVVSPSTHFAAFSFK